MASENLVNDLFEIVQSNAKEKLSYDDFEKDLIKSINLPNDEMDRALSIMLSQAEVNPNVIGESKGGTFVISPSFSASVVSTIKYENQFIEGKSENTKRIIENNKNDAIFDAAFAANIIMTPQVIDRMIINYGTLSGKEMGALWGASLVMEPSQKQALRDAHDNYLKEAAKKMPPEEAEKVDEMIEDGRTTSTIVDEAKKGNELAIGDIIKRLNIAREEKGSEFEKTIEELLAAFGVSYETGMDLSLIPQNIIAQVGGILESIERESQYSEVSGQELGGSVYKIPIGNQHTYPGQEERYISKTVSPKSINELDNDSVESIKKLRGSISASFDLYISSSHKQILGAGWRTSKGKYKTLENKDDLKKGIKMLDGKVKAVQKNPDEVNKALIIYKKIIEKITPEQLNDKGFDLDAYIDMAVGMLSSDDSQYVEALIALKKALPNDYIIKMLRNSPRHIVLDMFEGAVQFRESGKEFDKFFEDFVTELDEFKLNPAEKLQTQFQYRTIKEEQRRIIRGKSIPKDTYNEDGKTIAEELLAKYVGNHEETLDVNMAEFEKIRKILETLGYYSNGDKAPINMEQIVHRLLSMKKEDADKFRALYAQELEPQKNTEDSREIIDDSKESDEHSEERDDDSGVFFGNEDDNPFADAGFDSFMISVDKKVATEVKPKEPAFIFRNNPAAVQLNQESERIEENGDEIPKYELGENTFLNPLNKGQAKLIVRGVTTSRVKTEADIVMDALKLMQKEIEEQNKGDDEPTQGE